MGRFSRRSRYDVALGEVAELVITCEDCGREKTWDSERIRQEHEQGLRTVPEVWKRLVCSYCQNRESPGKNVRVEPKLRGRGRTK